MDAPDGLESESFREKRFHMARLSVVKEPDVRNCRHDKTVSERFEL
jgi:hypothetical protein